MFLNNRPVNLVASVLLAHGAGAPMDTPFMNAFAQGLCAQGVHVARFEFGYMAARRESSSKRPPPRAERLMDEYCAAIGVLAAKGPLIIGGKSLGGRVASLVAQDAFVAGRIAGLLCLGYPFHPPGKPEKPRTAHLMRITAPALIAQGERDPFGNIEDVAGYDLPPNFRLHWAGDGDHDLKPRKKSGLTAEQNWQSAIEAISGWVARVCA